MGFEEPDVVHHRALHGGLDRGINFLAGDADDGGVQRVYPLTRLVGEGVRHGDQIPAGGPTHRCQFDIDQQFVPATIGRCCSKTSSVCT